MTDRLNLVHKRRAYLQEGVRALGACVVEALHRSVACLKAQDKALAAEIIAGDRLIDQHRRLLEQECLVTLAAYKPAGVDLRAIGACMELAPELERLGDYAADVARLIARDLEGPLPPELVAALVELAEDAIGMLEQALAAVIANDTEARARAAVAQEPEVDREETHFIAQVLERMRSDAAFARTGAALLWIAHYYERVADRATNVAERAIYVASGHTPDLT